MIIAESILVHTFAPSQTFQKKNGDLVTAYASIFEIERFLSKFKSETEKESYDVFTKATVKFSHQFI